VKVAQYDVCMATISPEVLERARKIKLFLMDVDGTLTDGGVNLLSLPGDGGIAEMKVFNSQDGAGLKLAHIMGIRTGFITGRKSPAVSQRAHELSVEFVYLGQATKMAAFDECLQKAGVQADEVAYMGDDLPDMLPNLRQSVTLSPMPGAARAVRGRLWNLSLSLRVDGKRRFPRP
jgi:3-deoxy-D-manno-octulosonate 8-phosphate phosphatase (KDO 8-P phosphatase)